MSDLAFSSLVEVGQLIQKKTTTSLEVTTHILDRIKQLDSQYHAYALVMEESAISEAVNADKEIDSGKIRGPLHGVPVAVKDLCDTAGIKTSCGMPMFRDRVPSKDATVVARLRDAGAVILGKLQMTEGALAMHHPDIIPPINPWAEDRWSGASSSGSGVSVAAGLAYGSLGSDTGGSIRFPSLCNGLVGIKGTWGRVSRAGVFPLSDTLDHVGPMTRRVEDAAAMLTAIAGIDPSDPTSLAEPTPDYLLEIEKGVSGLRVGFDRGYCSDDVHPIIVNAVNSAVNALANEGAEIVEIKMPPTDKAVSGWVPLCIAEAVIAHRETFPSRADEYSDTLRGFLEAGNAVTGPSYAEATINRRELSGAMAVLHQSVDLVVTLTMPQPIPTVNEFSKIGEAADGVEQLIKYTCIADLTGNPTISLPTGFDNNGAPIGIQLMGAPMSESLLCRAGYICQKVNDQNKVTPN